MLAMRELARGSPGSCGPRLLETLKSSPCVQECRVMAKHCFSLFIVPDPGDAGADEQSLFPENPQPASSSLRTAFVPGPSLPSSGRGSLHTTATADEKEGPRGETQVFYPAELCLWAKDGLCERGGHSGSAVRRIFPEHNNYSNQLTAEDGNLLLVTGDDVNDQIWWRIAQTMQNLRCPQSQARINVRIPYLGQEGKYTTRWAESWRSAARQSVNLWGGRPDSFLEPSISSAPPADGVTQYRFADRQ
ncbi:hypothetical protein VTK26DRAFT_2528 [Humicola hyalothermophila]